MYIRRERDSYIRVLAIEFDGKSVLEALKGREKWELQSLTKTVEAEGGYIENGIIHRGNAQPGNRYEHEEVLGNDVRLHDELVYNSIIRDKYIGGKPYEPKCQLSNRKEYFLHDCKTLLDALKKYPDCKAADVIREWMWLHK